MTKVPLDSSEAMNTKKRKLIEMELFISLFLSFFSSSFGIVKLYNEKKGLMIYSRSVSGAKWYHRKKERKMIKRQRERGRINRKREA